MPRSANFSEIGVCSGFCGVFRAFTHARHTAKKSGVSNPWARAQKQRETGVQMHTTKNSGKLYGSLSTGSTTQGFVDGSITRGFIVDIMDDYISQITPDAFMARPRDLGVLACFCRRIKKWANRAQIVCPKIADQYGVFDHSARSEKQYDVAEYSTRVETCVSDKFGTREATLGVERENGGQQGWVGRP